MPDSPSNLKSTSTSPRWTSRKAFQIYCHLTVLIYLFGVAFLAILKFTTHLVDGLSTPELFYGPAMTVASAWLIGLLISALIPVRFTQGDPRGRRFASVLFTIILLSIGVTFLAVHFLIFRQTSASALINHPEYYYTHFVIRDGSGQSVKSISMAVGFWSYFTALGGFAAFLWGITRIILALKHKPQDSLDPSSP